MDVGTDAVKALSEESTQTANLVEILEQKVADPQEKSKPVADPLLNHGAKAASHKYQTEYDHLSDTDDDDDNDLNNNVLFKYEPQKTKYVSNVVNNNAYKSILTDLMNADFLEDHDDTEFVEKEKLDVPKLLNDEKNNTSTTTTTTTITSSSETKIPSLSSLETSSSSPSSTNNTPRSSSFIATPTIAILPPDLLIEDDPLSSSSKSLNASTNSNSSKEESRLEPTSPVSSATTPTKASANNNTNTNNTNNNNNNNNTNNNNTRTGFFQRMFRRGDSKTNMSSSPSKEDINKLSGSSGSGTTSSSPNVNSQRDGDNFIVNTFSNLSLSLPSLPSVGGSKSNSNSNNATPNVNNQRHHHQHSHSVGNIDLIDEAGNHANSEQTTSINSSTSSARTNVSGSTLMKDYTSKIEENELLSYEHFLFKLDAAAHIKSSIDSFVRTLKNRRVANDDLREALLDFVYNMQNSLTLDPQWETSAQEELSFAGNHLQQYVLEQIYDYVFQDDEESVKKDAVLSKTIDKLYFITPEHLEIPQHSFNEEMWSEAGQYLLKINFTQSCRHKMLYITKACKTILKYLGSQTGESAGADSLLPNLILVVLRNNPPYLNSNVLFISKFSDSSDSEALYYMTQLVAAIYFIENLNSDMLKIDKKEFNRLMGNSFLPLSSSNNSSPKIPPRVSSPKNLENDNALANLAEMFPDIDTKYLSECIRYIESKHKAKISQTELVSRVTNFLAEQEFLQQQQELLSSSHVKVFKDDSSKIQINNDHQLLPKSTSQTELNNVIESVLNPEPLSLEGSNSLNQQNEEVTRLQQKLNSNQYEILELKKTLQMREKELKSLYLIANQFKFPNSLHNFSNHRIDELKITEVPMLLQEYKHLFTILKNTVERYDEHSQQHQKK